MKKKTYVKWFLLVSTALGSLTSFAIYNSLKKENSKSIKIDYNKVHLMLNDKGFRKNFLNSNNLGKNSQKFDEMLKSNISSFQKKKYNLDNLVDKSKKLESNAKQSNRKYKNLKNHHINSNNEKLTLEQKNYLNDSNLFGNLFKNQKTFDSSANESWDDWMDRAVINWTALSNVLISFQTVLIATAVIAAAAAAAYTVMAIFSFGATLEEVIECSEVCVQSAIVTTVLAGAISIINASIAGSDNRYALIQRINAIYLTTIVGLGVTLAAISVSYDAAVIPCPPVLIAIAGTATVLAVIAGTAHSQDEAKNYFIMEGVHFNKNDIQNYSLYIDKQRNVSLSINTYSQHVLKVNNLSSGLNDYESLISMFPNKGLGENFKLHGQLFDLRKVNSFDVQVTDNKNTTLTIDDGKKHQFKQNLNDSEKDYVYLNSIMTSKGNGINFKFHNKLFDINKINSFNVQVFDNNNTTLTINDSQKHQFKQNLNDSNKDYDYLQLIMPKQGQGKIFKLHGQSFDLRKVNSFGIQVTNNKNTTLIIDDGIKHQFKQNLNESNKDYDYLQSIMPKHGQGEIFNFHGQSFDLKKITLFNVQVIDNKNTTLTIDDGQKHQFKQNLNESNKDYDYLQSIMPKQGQGEIFKFHGQSFDLRKVNSFDVQVIDNKNTTLTINDSQKHQFKQNLNDSNKDYDYLQSIMPNHGQGEIFNFHGHSFDLRKVNSFDVQVTDNKNTVLTIDDGQKHQFNQNLTDSNQDYDYL
ncbi:MAG: hypothetical protein ACRDCG_01290, partial [Mycoplasmoidaceae bacterium]